METKEKDKEMEIIRPSLSNTSCLERHINWLKLPEWLPGLLRGRTGLLRNIMRSLHCLFPNFDDCVTVCSNTIELEKLIWSRSLTFMDNSKVTAPDYASKVLVVEPHPIVKFVDTGRKPWNSSWKVGSGLHLRTAQKQSGTYLRSSQTQSRTYLRSAQAHASAVHK